MRRLALLALVVAGGCTVGPQLAGPVVTDVRLVDHQLMIQRCQLEYWHDNTLKLGACIVDTVALPTAQPAPAAPPR